MERDFSMLKMNDIGKKVGIKTNVGPVNKCFINITRVHEQIIDIEFLKYHLNTTFEFRFMNGSLMKWTNKKMNK